MANELKGLAAGLIAGVLVVGASYGVSAIVTHGQPAETPQAKPVPPDGAQTTASSQMVAIGASLYVQNCVSCHGKDGAGKIGPTLHHLGDPDAKIARNISNGFPPRMPAYKDMLNPGQIQALVAYVQSLK